jgi:hypothetical protein
MTFLYPSFLWAMSVLAIPVIVHLFNFRKSRKIYFSNTRFIQQVQEATSAKRRLKHYLVLFSRLLFLFFLVLVFAQPIIPASDQLQTGENVVLYVDNSQSMSAPVEGNQQAIDASLSIARNIVENFPPDIRYRLLTNDFAPFSNSLKTRNEVVDLLSQVRLAGRSRSAREISERLRRLGHEQEVFWISDFQVSTTGQPLPPDSLKRWHLIPLQTLTSDNIFVDTAYLDKPFAIGGERNTLIMKFYNEGAQPRDQFTARLVMDGLQTGTASLALPANGSVEASFDLPTGLSGAHKAVISFTDTPITFDNKFFGVINFSDRVRVMEIKQDAKTTVVEKVFGNKAVFDFASATSKSIDYSRLGLTDLIVLNELPEIDNALLQALQNYLASGRSLLLIPSASPSIESYRKLVPAITTSKQEKLLSLGRPDFADPFFANVFQEKSAQLAMPEVRNAIEWGTDRQAILKQSDDKPYLSLFRTTGNVYVLGSPLQQAYGSFFSNALFVPVMYRMAAFSRRNQQPVYYLLPQRLITIRSDSTVIDGLLTLSGEQELTPAQRTVNGQVMLDLGGLDLHPGHYSVIAGSDSLTFLAFNQAKDESKLEVMKPEEILSTFGPNAEIYSIDTSTEATIGNTIRENYQGKSLWKYALLLALLFLFAEVLLLRFWK